MGSKRAFAPAVAGVVAVLLVAVILVVVLGNNVSLLTDSQAAEVAAGTANGTYFAANETLRVSMSPELGYPGDTDAATVRIMHDGDGPVVLRRGGTTVQNGVWYAPDPPRVLDQAPGPGAAVTVVGDGTDADDDGVAGVECGEVYEVKVTAANGHSRKIERFRISEMGESCGPAG